MRITNTILAYRGQPAAKVLQVKGQRRVADNIAFTRHLIKYFLYVHCGYSTKTIERQMGRLSDGFNHSSVLHSVKTVSAQPYIFATMISDIISLLIYQKEEV